MEEDELSKEYQEKKVQGREVKSHQNEIAEKAPAVAIVWIRVKDFSISISHQIPPPI